MGMSDHITIFCPRCQGAGRIEWCEPTGNFDKHYIDSVTEGFVFVADSKNESRIECDKCHQTINELKGLIAGWDRRDNSEPRKVKASRARTCPETPLQQ